MNTEEAVFSIMAAGIVMFLVGLTVGTMSVESEVKSEATGAGAAHWQVDTVTGDKTFHWGPAKARVNWMEGQFDD